MSDEPAPIGDVLKHLADARQVQDAKPRDAAPLQIPDRAAQRLEAQRAVVAARWEAMVPPQLALAHLAQLDGVPGCSEVIKWADPAGPSGDGVNLFILGDTGRGKSHAAVAAARPSIEAGLSCEFWPVVDLMSALHWETQGHRQLMARLQRVHLLVYDDLGAEDPNDWTRRKLYELANARWNANLPNIITTNLEPTDLEDAVGARTYSRLAGGAIATRLAGKDRRRHHAP